MTIINDKQILDLCRGPEGMIWPLVSSQRRVNDEGAPVISYGLSSYGYDARLGGEFSVPVDGVIDPKVPGDCRWSSFVRGGELQLKPHRFLLARTVEYFRIPDDVFALCFAKSTYARCGLVLGVTPLEPGWEGHVTLELSNTTHLPITIYPEEGICQFVFFRGERPAVTYGDRGGKYQGQTGVTLAKV